MQVPIRVSNTIGFSPAEAATAIATGVRMAAAAELVTILVVNAVTTANTTTTRAVSPPEIRTISDEIISPRPLFTTMVPRPIDPAITARMFQFNARTAERGVRTPVRTIRVAPAVATSSTEESPNEPATMTAARMASAIAVLAVCGAFPATFCQSPIMGWVPRTSAELADTRHIDPGFAAVSRRGTVVSAATASTSSSASISRIVACSSDEMDTRYRFCGARPNRGLPHSIRTPGSVAR